MMVKKKYVLHTIRQETLYKKSKLRRVNSNGNLQQRPSTAAASMTNSEQQLAELPQRQKSLKLNRPKTANNVIVVNNKPNPPSDKSTSMSSLLNPDNFASKIIANNRALKSNALAEDDYYHPFRLSPTCLQTQTWPFELEFDKYVKRRTFICKKSVKCFQCRKLPNMKLEMSQVSSTTVQTTSKQPQLPQQQVSKAKGLFMSNVAAYKSTPNPQEKQVETPKQPAVNNTEKINVSNRQFAYLNSTFNSSRRCMSAKVSGHGVQPFKNLIKFSFNAGKQRVQEAPTQQEAVPQIEEVNYEIECETECNSELNNDCYEIDKSLTRNIQVNKEEHLSKATILPGKSFRSQRTKSISVEHVPPSKKLIDMQKLKVPFASYQVSKTNFEFKRDFANKKLFSNIEGLKELAMQHQTDIFSLSEGNPKRETKVIVYGVANDNAVKSNVTARLTSREDTEADTTTTVYKEIKKINKLNLTYNKNNHLKSSLNLSAKSPEPPRLTKIGLEQEGRPNVVNKKNRPKTAKL